MTVPLWLYATGVLVLGGALTVIAWQRDKARADLVLYRAALWAADPDTARALAALTRRNRP